MRVYLFTDLDDTLFQTLRKCGVPPECTPTTAEAYDLSVGSWSRKGEALSFMTPEQRCLAGFFADAHVIPVTARDLDAFRRVQLSFTHGAVLNYGGTVLLPDGSEDLDWQAHMRTRLAPFQSLLQAGTAHLTGLAEREGLPVRVRCLGTAESDFYIVVKNVQPECCFLERMRKEGEAFFRDKAQWYVHLNDNNLAFIPTVLNKAHAVRHVIENAIAPLGEAFLTVGMGDSLVDLDFMNVCHYAIVPSGSQIQKARMHG